MHALGFFWGGIECGEALWGFSFLLKLLRDGASCPMKLPRRLPLCKWGENGRNRESCETKQVLWVLFKRNGSCSEAPIPVLSPLSLQGLFWGALSRSPSSKVGDFGGPLASRWHSGLKYPQTQGLGGLFGVLLGALTAAGSHRGTRVWGKMLLLGSVLIFLSGSHCRVQGYGLPSPLVLP